MAPPAKTTHRRPGGMTAMHRRSEGNQAAEIGTPMAPPLGRNLFAVWPPTGGFFHHGNTAEGGGGKVGATGHSGGGGVSASSEGDGSGAVGLAGEAPSDGWPVGSTDNVGDDGLQGFSQDMYSFPDMCGTMNRGSSYTGLMLHGSDMIGPNISSSQPEDHNVSPTDVNAFQAKPS